jgi:hypothetical protein
VTGNSLVRAHWTSLVHHVPDFGRLPLQIAIVTGNSLVRAHWTNPVHHVPDLVTLARR